MITNEYEEFPYVSPARSPEYYGQLAARWCAWNAIQQTQPRISPFLMMSATLIDDHHWSAVSCKFQYGWNRLIGLPTIVPVVEVPVVAATFVCPDLRTLFLREFQFTSRFLRGRRSDLVRRWIFDTSSTYSWRFSAGMDPRNANTRYKDAKQKRRMEAAMRSGTSSLKRVKEILGARPPPLPHVETESYGERSLNGLSAKFTAMIAAVKAGATINYVPMPRRSLFEAMNFVEHMDMANAWLMSAGSAVIRFSQ